VLALLVQPGHTKKNEGIVMSKQVHILTLFNCVQPV